MMPMHSLSTFTIWWPSTRAKLAAFVDRGWLIEPADYVWGRESASSDYPASFSDRFTLAALALFEKHLI